MSKVRDLQTVRIASETLASGERVFLGRREHVGPAGDDRLMVRVGNAAYEDLLDRPGCREMDFTGKSMKGFLFIYPEGFDNDADLDFWVKKALEYNHDGAVASKKKR